MATQSNRALGRAFTSLELGHRNWTVLSEKGKQSLSGCANCCRKRVYATGPSWGPLSHCEELQFNLTVVALQQQQKHEDDLRRVMAELDAVVEGMQAARDALADRVKSDGADADEHTPRARLGVTPPLKLPIPCTLK